MSLYIMAERAAYERARFANVCKSKDFPNDKRVIVLRKDMTKYTAWESHILITYHNWTPSEVRVQQLSYIK